jgi:hypothetical protein
MDPKAAALMLAAMIRACGEMHQVRARHTIHFNVAVYACVYVLLPTCGISSPFPYLCVFYSCVLSWVASTLHFP